MIDTIYALATPAGRSGVSVVRLSGPCALDALLRLTPRKDFQPRRTYLCNLYRPCAPDISESLDGREVIDQALVVYFKAPFSFTGEDVVELQPHGSPAVLKALMEALDQMEGLRLADPGEFTRRAFENDKMDLTAAEAVADLIHAETQLQRIQALSQMDGGLSRLYVRWTDELKTMLAHVEADLEFPDEDMPEGILPSLRPKLEILSNEISEHLNDNRRGERLRDGVQIAVIGAPNAGKSSLINHIAKRDIAIVSDIAGTTRDVIEAHLDIGGFPVIMADTAGLRPEQVSQSQSGHDVLEYEGIKRALKRAYEADLKMIVFNGGEEKIHSASLDLCDDKCLIVFNKSDLMKESDRSVIEDKFDKHVSFLSAQTGEGVSDLLGYLQERLTDLVGLRETPSLTQRRHRVSLEQALSHVKVAMRNNALPELAAEDLRLAVRFIGRITGRVDVEDLLDVIFNDFCIGK